MLAVDQPAAPAGRRGCQPAVDRGSSPPPLPLGPDHPGGRPLGLLAVLAALEALEGPLGLATQAPLGSRHPAGRAVLGPLPSRLLAGLVERSQPDRGRP